MTTSIRRILLAEDDPNDVELTLTALTDHAMVNEVDVVNDGAEAMDYLFCRGKYAGRATGLPAVVLLDIKMPKVDGIEVLRQLKSEGVTIVLVSHDIGVVAAYIDTIACLNTSLVAHCKPDEEVCTQALTEMYGTHAAFLHHGESPHLVVEEHLDA